MVCKHIPLFTVILLLLWIIYHIVSRLRASEFASFVFACNDKGGGDDVIDCDFGDDMIDLCSLFVSQCICFIPCNNS